MGNDKVNEQYTHNQFVRTKSVSAARIELDWRADSMIEDGIEDNLLSTGTSKLRSLSGLTPVLKFDLDAMPEPVELSDRDRERPINRSLTDMDKHFIPKKRLDFKRLSTVASAFSRFPSTLFRLKSKDHRGVIHPRSSTKFTFDIIIFMAILYLAFLVPLDITMDVEQNDPKTVLFWISRILDVLFITDLILNFFTALDSGNGIELITDKQEIARRYLRGWFTVDFVSSIPFDMILFLSQATFGSEDLMRTTKLLRFSKIIRVLKILRVMRLQRLNLSDSSAASGFQFQMLFDMGKNVASIIYGAHWLTCIFIFILKETEAENHKVMQSEGGERYIAALYFTFTYLTTIGFGDITADSPSQRIFMIFGLTIGSFGTTYFMSVIINLVVTKNQEKTKKRLLMNRIEEYMLYRRFPDELQRHIREYVRLVNNNTFTDERAILQTLSPELRKKCTTYNNGDYLLTVPYLRGSEQIPHFSYFLEELALQMRTVYFAADDLIARKNDFDDRIWFIELGSCKIFQHKKDEKKRYKMLKTGQYFGESALLADTFVIDYYVRAISWTGLVTLDHRTFARVLALYPTVRHFMREWLVHHSHTKIAHSKVTYAAIMKEALHLFGERPATVDSKDADDERESASLHQNIKESWNTKTDITTAVEEEAEEDKDGTPLAVTQRETTWRGATTDPTSPSSVS